MTVETISGYRFRPADLRIGERRPGISAFMRCRNGADFVAATIRSHVEFYDEIVVAYNQCEDDTPAILARLAEEFAPKIRVFHYTDRVQPLGSRGHAETPGDHPESMVNYSNFVLAQTRHEWAVKLDDDHLAIPQAVAGLVERLRAGRLDPRVQHCFSGFNLARAADGRLGIPAFDPVVGSGDHGYFRVSERTVFRHDRRFERFAHALPRRFAGFFYWHLKYLKAGEGFRNYELGANPDSRYAKKRHAFRQSRMVDLPQAVAALAPGPGLWLAALVAPKARLTLARNRAARRELGDATLEAALDRTSPGWRDVLGDRVTVESRA